MSDTVVGEWKIVRESRGESVEEQLESIDGMCSYCLLESYDFDLQGVVSGIAQHSSKKKPSNSNRLFEPPSTIEQSLPRSQSRGSTRSQSIALFPQNREEELPFDLELAGRSFHRSRPSVASNDSQLARPAVQLRGDNTQLPSLLPTKRAFVAHRIAAGHASSLGFYHAGPAAGAEELLPLHVGSGPVIRRHIFHRVRGDWADDPAAARKQSRRTVEAVERALHGRRRLPRCGHIAERRCSAAPLIAGHCRRRRRRAQSTTPTTHPEGAEEYGNAPRGHLARVVKGPDSYVACTEWNGLQARSGSQLVCVV